MSIPYRSGGGKAEKSPEAFWEQKWRVCMFLGNHSISNRWSYFCVKNKEDLKNWDNLPDEDNLKTEDDLKKEVNLKNKTTSKMKTTSQMMKN